MNAESTIRNMLFFPTVKNGLFDYSTPLKTNIKNFTENINNTEISPPLFEYLFYNIIKKKINEGYVNDETVFISERFLSSINCKKIFIKANAIHKKNILIFIQNKTTQKWNVIIFFDLENQLKKCMLDKENQSIIVKIISSSSENDEDDYILNSTMDKLENTFDFKSPDDIQFEVDSINICDQQNTSIFLLNFIEGLIIENNENFSKYIQKLYDEGSKMDTNSKNYLNSFNKMNDVFIDLQNKYQTELKNYLEKKEKTKNENMENGLENVDNFVNLDINKETNEMKDEIDLIQIEQDDDIEDDVDSEEEEALKIMEQENEDAKNQMKDQEKKLRQKLYKQKMRLANLNICKEFGVIKEEENESSSEKSFEIFNKNDREKNIKDEIEFLKRSITNLRKFTDELNQQNISQNEINEKEIEKNENNNNEKNNNKEEDNINGNTINENDNNINSSQKKSNNIDKINKNIKKKKLIVSALKNLEEAIQELEKEITAQPKKESKNENLKNINNNKNNTTNTKNINNNTNKKQIDNGNPKIDSNKFNELKKANTLPKQSKILTIDNTKIGQKNDALEKKINNTKNKISNTNNEKNITDSPNKKSDHSLDSNKSGSFKGDISPNNSNNNKKEKPKKNNKAKKNQDSAKKRNKSPIENNYSNKNSNDTNELKKKNSSHSSRDSTNTQKTNKTEELFSTENNQKEKEIKLEHNISNDSEVDNEHNYTESLNEFRSQKINEIKKENNKILFPKKNNNDYITERRESEKSRTRKSLLSRRQDKNGKTKLKMPPSKNRNYLPFNENFCDVIEGDDNNICGWCIGEESNSGCFIF